nr:MAG TPA: hypothetical protein [Caudoviricetes sp.]
MKRILLILLISLLGTTLSFSQDTYPKVTKDSLVVITPQQLKQTNLIFLEHQKLSKEVVLLMEQTKNLEIVNLNLKRADSIRTVQLRRCMLQAEINDQAITALNKTVEQKNQKIKKWKNWTIGGFTVSAGLLAILLIK